MDPGARAVDDVHMPGQHGRAGTASVTAVAVSLAGVLVAAVGVAALRTDTAGADTVLQRGPGAVLALPDGSSRPAVEGERVPRGATVRAGRAGAVLQTRDREVYLGGATAVTVLDGVRQVLDAGFVLVDASAAPGLQLATGAGTVRTEDGSLVRVDGGPLVRVGVLRGAAAAVRAAGRRATAQVPTYFQVQVPRGGLPGAVTPFVLTPGDAYERRLAADLVAADEALEALAARLDAGPAARVVLTSLREVAADPVPEPAGREQAVGFLIATAAAEPGSLAARYDRVRELREAGGSWGVVAAIVSAEVDRVGAALDALLEPGTVPVLAAGPLDVEAALGLGGAGPAAPQGPPAGSGGDRPVRGTGDRGGDGSGGDRGGGSSPSPSPSPTSSPTDPVTDLVQEVVDTVLGLVSPSPSPSSAAPVREPVPVPLPVPLPVPTPTPLPLLQ